MPIFPGEKSVFFPLLVQRSHPHIWIMVHLSLPRLPHPSHPFFPPFLLMGMPNSFDEAAKCYLQALRLNPEAMHIWGYLRVTFTSMERFDLVQLAGQQDPSLFDAEFGW